MHFCFLFFFFLFLRPSMEEGIKPENPLMINPCFDQPFASYPFCDPTLDLNMRVSDAIGRLQLEEKFLLLANQPVVGVKSLGLLPYNFWNEATHGVGSGRFENPTPWATNFAFPITLAMSFNRSLWKATGAQIGREARAFMNEGNGFSTFWAPVINCARDPRWGRNIETPGEDPLVAGEYAVQFVTGFEQNPDDPSHLQASACCKHFVANEMENSTEAGVTWNRRDFDAAVPLQDLVDSYLPPFQDCVQRGRVSCLMCSYNSVNGVPACANDWLLQTLARDAWGFDGYITSDCDADGNVWDAHHYTKTPEEAVAAVLHAGTDLDCGGFVSGFGPFALKQGLITVTDVDRALAHMFRVRMRLGHFDPTGPLDRINASVICSPAAQALAQDGAAQAVALVKNANSLPLRAETVGQLAVIGPNALLSADIAGYYGPSNVCNNEFPSLFSALAELVPSGRAIFAAGVSSVSAPPNATLTAEAVQLARNSDTVVLVLGTDLTIARENHDASSLALSEGQSALLEDITRVAKQPVIVVMLTAVPLDVSTALASPLVGAVLHAGQPSLATKGVASVMFGLRVPAGRLVQTVLPESYAHQISIFDFNMRPGPSAFPRPDCAPPFTRCPNGTNPGRTYRFYTGAALLPFGFGLSYTTFLYHIAKTTGLDSPGTQEAGTPRLLASLGQCVRMWVDRANLRGPSVASLSMARSESGSERFRSCGEIGSGTPMDEVSYEINVTNTGRLPFECKNWLSHILNRTWDADDVVLGFISAPGAGTGGIPLQSLFGFERVYVPVGQTVSVWLYPALRFFTHLNAEGTWEVLEGDYEV